MLNVIQDSHEVSRRGFLTNYPPFRHWRREMGERGLEPQPLNLYIHTPYCIQRCAYCHYKTTTLRESQKKEIDRYIEALCKEIEVSSKRFHLKDRPVTTLYFGGGTPTLLSGENIDRLMTTLHENLWIQEPEITFEGEPVTLTRRKAEILEKHGVNRISVGIQSFCDDVVFKTGRRDTEEQALESIRVAIDIGATVNIDLISGLAGETFETWDYSVRRAIETGVHSITVYKLEVYANTEYYDDLRRQEIHLPSDDEELRYVRHAIESLDEADYRPVNFFTFTRGGGHVQRHTTSKWRGADTYAFGSSAFGNLGSWAYQNVNDLEQYCALVEKGEPPVFRGFVSSSLDLMVRDVILGMKLIHLDRQDFRRRHGLDVVSLCPGTVDELEASGFLTVSDEALSLTEKGILYGDYTGRVLASALESLND